MCYIAGMISLDGRLDNRSISEFLDCMKSQLLLRGRDAVGIIIITESGITEIKRPLNNPKEDIDKVICSINNVLNDYVVKGILIQTRAIPEPEFLTAGNTLDNVQPFYIDNWITSHNGTISNNEDLKSYYLQDYHFKDLPKTDSVVLPLLFQKNGVINSIKKVKGSFSIAAYDNTRDDFWLIKNFQPLYYSNYNSTIYYSSLPTKYSNTEFPAYKALRFHRDDIKEYDLYNRERNDSILVCLSSGLDSAVTLGLYKALGYKTYALYYDYGQYAKKLENHCSRKICRFLGITRYLHKLPMDFFTSPLLSDKKHEMGLEDAETTFSYVPQRNLIMASYALGYAEQLGLGGIAIGMNLADAGAYPDNGIPFLDKLNELTPYSSNWNTRLRVTAPLVNLMKSEIVKLGLHIGVPFEYVCSCYYPELEKLEDGSNGDRPIYCGRCGSDIHYKNAWNKLGYRPPNLGFNDVDYELAPRSGIKDGYEIEELPFSKVLMRNI